MQASPNADAQQVYTLPQAALHLKFVTSLSVQQLITLCDVSDAYRQAAARLTVKGFLQMAARLTVKGFLQMTGVTVHTLCHQQKRGEQVALLPVSCVDACAAHFIPCQE